MLHSCLRHTAPVILLTNVVIMNLDLVSVITMFRIYSCSCGYHPVISYLSKNALSTAQIHGTTLVDQQPEISGPAMYLGQ